MKIEPLFESEHHPVVITPGADKTLPALHEYLRSESASLKHLLGQHGGILFRGFEVDSAEDFRASNECLGAQPFDYVGGNSPRSRIAADVFTSTEYPASEVISLHNEMSYLPAWPRRLFFYSAITATSGGQTSLAHGGDVMGTARAWLESGEAHRVSQWLDAGVFDADAAARLAGVGLQPHEVAVRVERSGQRNTLGYWVANGDISAERAAEIVREVVEA